MKKNDRAECVIFDGYIDRDGYGRVGRRLAHRVAWQNAFGPIPSGMQVCHYCDVRCCVNPKHLWLGSNAENTADRCKKGRSARGSRHGRSKLTEDQVVSILADSRKQTEIALDYGVKGNTICRIKSGEIWSHIKRP